MNATPPPSASTLLGLPTLSRRRLLRAAGLALLAVPLAGCTAVRDLTGLSLTAPPSAAPTSQARTGNTSEDLGNANAQGDVVFDSQFTKNGVSNIYLNNGGIDYVLSIFPSQTNPRSDLWYPRGDKEFTFTFQTYDLAKPLDAPYAEKRMTYLRDVSISSTLTLVGSATSDADADGEADGERAQQQTMSGDFAISGLGQDLTFDPEPWVEDDLGMRIASPKGVFEMRRQVIGDLPREAVGITLHFSFYVNAQRTAGEDAYDAERIEMDVPIGIASSDEETPSRTVPVDAA